MRTPHGLATCRGLDRRTHVDPSVDHASGGFEIAMYTITPEGEETLAVRNRYVRAS